VNVEPVVGRAALRLMVAPSLRRRLASVAAGRPLVVDYFATRLRGVAAGDLVVWFGDPHPEPCYLELEPIDEVVVLAERHLVGVLDGATLREGGPPWQRHLVISLARPDDWIDFLDRHPSRSA
jgi:hypothetical protein